MALAVRSARRPGWRPALPSYPDLVARAWRTALEGTPGPVHITLPFDVLEAKVEDSDVPIPDDAAFDPSPVGADHHAVERAVEILASARRPLLLGSVSVWRGEAGERLRALLETSQDARLHRREPARPDRSVAARAGPGVSAGRRGSAALPAGFHDRVRRTERAGRRPADPGRSHARRACPEPSGRGGPGGRRGHGPRTARSGGAGALLAVDWLARGARSRPPGQSGSNGATRDSDEAPIHPLTLATVVRDALDDGDSVILDGGEMGQWARWAIGTGRFTTLTNGKLGGIGCGIPFSIAAKIARPGSALGRVRRRRYVRLSWPRA